MMWLWIILGVLGGLILLLLIGLYIVYKGTFYTPVKGQNDDYLLTGATLEYCDVNIINNMITEMRNIPYEDAYVTSFDKKKLHARVYKNNSDTVCIMFPGYRGTPCRDFSGGAHDMIDAGFNVVLIEERGHGESQGHSITFGVREREDAKSWIKYARETFGEDKRIVLIGISMGGATVLYASDLLKEGDKVISDCPYTTPKEVIFNTLKYTLKMNPKIFYPLANLSSILFGHTNLNHMDARDFVKNSKADIMIIHGEKDTLVPQSFSKALKELFPDKIRYESFPTAEHGLSYIMDKERYRSIVNDFLGIK